MKTQQVSIWKKENQLELNSVDVHKDMKLLKDNGITCNINQTTNALIIDSTDIERVISILGFPEPHHNEKTLHTSEHWIFQLPL